MEKSTKLISFFILLALVLSVIGCGSKNISDIKAVYLTTKDGGQLSKDELKKHPEVTVVNNFDDLKNSVVKKVAVWIDKDAVNLLEQDWLQKEPQKRYPLLLIGYNDAVYSFKEKLNGFGIEGGDTNWSQKELEPGFSVWMLKEDKWENEKSISAFLKGYNMSPNVKSILSISNILLEGKFPEIEESDKFSEEEINDAINCVKKKFKDFEGCNLTKLWYDEEKSNNFIEGYLRNGKGSVNGVKAENVIVLLSNFDVDSSGGDGSLNPNSTYSNWIWILIRDSKTGNWQVDDWGY